MKKKIEVEIQIPSIPNYIRYEGDVLGDDEGRAVPIEDFTEKELREIGRLWTDELVAKAKVKGKGPF